MYIYKITNLINGKVYIGQTIQKPENRWRAHKIDQRKESYLQIALNKYNVQNFLFEVIDETIDSDILNQKECFYIVLFNSMAPNGYNLQSGGNRHISTEETKRKQSLKKMGSKGFWTGKKRRPEDIEKVRQKLIGRPSPNKGKKLSEKLCDKLSIAHNPKLILATALDNSCSIYFLGARELEANGFSEGSVYANIGGHTKSYLGFQWRYI